MNWTGISLLSSILLLGEVTLNISQYLAGSQPAGNEVDGGATYKLGLVRFSREFPHQLLFAVIAFRPEVGPLIIPLVFS